MKYLYPILSHSGLLPGYDRIADPAAGKEKSMDQSDGEARNQNGEELVGPTLKNGDEGEVEKIIEAEEKGGERVVEADTSDEEPEFFNGEVKYRGCKQVLEVRETSSVPDNMDNFYTNYYHSGPVHGRIMNSKAGEIPSHQNVKNKAYDPPSYMNLDTMGFPNRDGGRDTTEALVNNQEIELVVDVDDSDEEVDATHSVKFDGAPVRFETTPVKLENKLEGNPTMTRTFPEELETKPERVVASLVNLETILEVSELEPEESIAVALVDAEDSDDEEELDNMNLMVTDLVVDVENSEEEEEEDVIYEGNETSHVNPETCPVTPVTIPVECATFPGRDKSLGKLETILEVSEPESEGSAARALVVEEESDEEELENMILMVTDLVVDVENSEEEGKEDVISEGNETSNVIPETRPVTLVTIPVECKTLPERDNSLGKLETILEVSEPESEGSAARALVVEEESDEEELENMILMVNDLVVDVENSEEEVEFISSRDENSHVNLETSLVTFPLGHDTICAKFDSFPVKVETIPLEHETIPERLRVETSVKLKLETMIEVSELRSKGSPKKSLGVDDSDEDTYHMGSCVSIFQRRKLRGLIQPTRKGVCSF